MPANPLIENESVVQALQHALQSGSVGLKLVPALVSRVIEEHRWQERLVERTRERARFEAFAVFVIQSPPEGLGSDLATIKRLCWDDAKALDLIDQATEGRQGERTDLVDNINNVEADRPTGTSRQQALRRLRKDAPELHAQVLAGKKSAHAAMVEAGFRRQPAPLEQLRAAWKKADAAARATFLAEVNES